MAEMLCGGDMATTSLLVAVVIPMFNILSVIALEVFRGGKVRIKKILLGIIKNPLIISSLLGLLALAAGVRFPTPVEKAIADLAGIATVSYTHLQHDEHGLRVLPGTQRADCRQGHEKIFVKHLAVRDIDRCAL